MKTESIYTYAFLKSEIDNSILNNEIYIDDAAGNTMFALMFGSTVDSLVYKVDIPTDILPMTPKILEYEQYILDLNLEYDIFIYNYIIKNAKLSDSYE